MKIVDHIRRWNVWRKSNLNGHLHHIFVLFGIIKSPTFMLALLPEDKASIEEMVKKWEKGENDA